MSKTSKKRDLGHHVSQGIWANRSKGFCVGCGYYHAVHNQHRSDCTKGKHHRETDPTPT